MYCRKEMVKILKCYLIPKKSYGTLSKDAIFFGQPCIMARKSPFIIAVYSSENYYLFWALRAPDILNVQ